MAQLAEPPLRGPRGAESTLEQGRGASHLAQSRLEQQLRAGRLARAIRCHRIDTRPVQNPATPIARARLAWLLAPYSCPASGGRNRPLRLVCARAHRSLQRAKPIGTKPSWWFKQVVQQGRTCSRWRPGRRGAARCRRRCRLSKRRVLGPFLAKLSEIRFHSVTQVALALGV